MFNVDFFIEFLVPCKSGKVYTFHQKNLPLRNQKRRISSADSIWPRDSNASSLAKFRPFPPRISLGNFLHVSRFFSQKKGGSQGTEQFCQANDEYVMFKQFSQLWCFPSKLRHLIIAWLDATLV